MAALINTRSSVARRVLAMGTPEYAHDTHQRFVALNTQVEALYEMMPFGSYLTGSGGTILNINSAALTLFGRDRNDLVGKVVPRHCFNSKSADQLSRLLDPCDQDFDSYRIELSCGNGITRHIIVSGRLLSEFSGELKPYRFFMMEESGSPQVGARRSAKGVDVICRYIVSHGPPHLTLSEMVALTGLTARALNYAFRQRFGCSPMEWQRMHFLELANQCLTGNNVSASIKTVAKQFGFASAAAFSTFYKRRFGHNPSDIDHSGAT
jgi:AraC-like DNA-binding protein